MEHMWPDDKVFHPPGHIKTEEISEYQRPDSPAETGHERFPVGFQRDGQWTVFDDPSVIGILSGIGAEAVPGRAQVAKSHQLKTVKKPGAQRMIGQVSEKRQPEFGI